MIKVRYPWQLQVTYPWAVRGGAGSGNWAHTGRPGKRGGSGGGGGLGRIGGHKGMSHEERKTASKQHRTQKPGAFTTSQQAEGWLLKTHGVKADLAGFNQRQINEVADGVDRVAKIYKGDLPINRIEQTRDGNFAARAGGKRVLINKEAFNETLLEDMSDTGIAKYRQSQKRLDRAKQQLSEVGDDEEYRTILTNRIGQLESDMANFEAVPFGASRSYSDLIVHEIAHEIDADLALGVLPDVRDRMTASRRRQLGEKNIEHEDTFNARAFGIAKQEGRKISEYATTNDSEYFAEAFVKYAQGETEGINPEVLGIFKRITK